MDKKNKPMNTAQNLYAETHTALTYQVDFDCRLALPAVFMLLQEAAWHHADNHGWGYEGLRRRGWFWVLSKMWVEMLYYPLWTDVMRIETWSNPPDLLTAIRDFEGFGADGGKFLAASSSWLILSRSDNRVQPLAEYARAFPHLEGRNAIAHKPPKIAAPDNPAVTARSAVQPSDIDMHQHVNNARYVQWALDSFGIDFLRGNAVRAIGVNFLSQGKAADPYAVATSAIGGNTYISAILNHTSGKEMARIKTLWQCK